MEEQVYEIENSIETASIDINHEAEVVKGKCSKTYNQSNVQYPLGPIFFVANFLFLFGTSTEMDHEPSQC